MPIDWLIYRSRPSVIPWPGAILDVARAAERFNPDAGLHGMLLFSSDRYLQYLEGPAAALEELWRRISSDTRHDIEWMERGTSEMPRLGNLPMGYFDADRESLDAQTHPVLRDRHDWQATDAIALTDLLVDLAATKYPSTMPHRGG